MEQPSINKQINNYNHWRMYVREVIEKEYEEEQVSASG